MPAKKVAIIMGSDSDMPVMKAAVEVLEEFKIKHEVKILSAHRTPRQTEKFAEEAREKGFGVIIAGAGGAAHLGGVIAAFTTLPVLGVPIETKSLLGLDSLLSIVQMPPGIPVGCVSIGGAKNAALLAVEILSLQDEELAKKLSGYRKEMAKAVLAKNKKIVRKK
ncbi:MAG: 5-(carboxyamino)imidazole ribonucleotide mutase [Candidatus Omnitrophota bacterium]